MTPIEILIRSALDSKGFEAAKHLAEELGQAVKAGFGINIGEKLAEAIEEIPAKLKEGISEGIRFNAAIEDQQRLFETLLGSIDSAHERVRDLVEFSEAHPIFSFAQVAEASRVLQVLTKGTMSSGEGLKLVGDLAAATGRSIGEMAELVGRLYSQLNEGLPLERSVMALHNMGVISGETVRELNEISEKGLGIGHAMEIVEKTFSNRAGAMGKAGETLNGQMKTLGSNLESIFGSLTEKTTKDFEKMLASMNSFLGSTQMKQMLEAAKHLPTPIENRLFGLGSGGLEASFSTNGRPRNPAGSNAESVEKLQAELAEEAKKKLEEEETAWLQLAKSIEVAAEGTKEFYEIQNDLEQEQLDKLASETDDLRAFHELQKQLDSEDLQRAQDKLRVTQEQLELARAKLDADFARPEFEKRSTRIKLLTDEIAAVDQLIKKLTELRDAENDPAAKAALNQQILGQQDKKTGLEVQKIGLTESANPNSFRDQWVKALADIRGEWGTLAQQIGEDFKTTVNSAIQSTSSELARAIVLTGDFDAALKNIAVTILTDIIEAIIQMGIRWVLTQIFAHTIGETLKGEALTSTGIEAAAAAKLWAPAAMAASIATEGEADAVGAAAFGVAMAGAAAAAFQTGDYTGDGDPNEVAGLVHKREFVFTAPQTRAIGVENLRAIAKGGIGAAAMQAYAGAFGGAGAGGGSNAAGAGMKAPQVHVGFLGDSNAVKEFMESRQGQKLIVDTVQKTVLAMQN